jgi:hypothetical protein
MAAGADSIDDLDVLRTGAMDRLFRGIRAPSTLGTFLRRFDIGHATALEAFAAQVLTRLTRSTGGRLLPGVGDYATVDLDSKITRVYGSRKVGANYGYTHVRGYNFLAATLSTPIAAPAILATRLRGGQADTRRGATSFLRQALRTARGCGATGQLLARSDSGYYVCSLLHAIVDAGARFSITMRQHPGLAAVIAGIDERDWVPITYATPGIRRRHPDLGSAPRRSSMSFDIHYPGESQLTGLSRRGVLERTAPAAQQHHDGEPE